ncbi:hypothetical protein SMD44_05103 [Streptomyces alboflavus]|uniref:Uncharacterized protein n=1 Tax=Streptomyces alboflavus TaxID=67267 RepID=A0A1Z1WGZ1_9ACTN|nr:hypothetical protein [Streptomyces alboflavus]ARX85639.1 hypothetical protein SMD44_05103 [Streptomyces alboflavus]
MSQQGETHNKLSGTVHGGSVQAGHIHGNVEFNTPAQRRSPEEEEIHRRKLARDRRILDDWEARHAEEQRRGNRYVQECRLGKWACAFALPVALVVAALGALHVISVNFAAIGLLGVLGSAFGWFYNAWVIRNWEAGRRITLPNRWRED